jgi:hypothetical protein
LVAQRELRGVRTQGPRRRAVRWLDLKGVKHSIEQMKRDAGIDVELVTGEEADKLFTEMAQRLQSSGQNNKKENRTEKMGSALSV